MKTVPSRKKAPANMDGITRIILMDDGRVLNQDASIGRLSVDKIIYIRRGRAVAVVDNSSLRSSPLPH